MSLNASWTAILGLVGYVLSLLVVQRHRSRQERMNSLDVIEQLEHNVADGKHVDEAIIQQQFANEYDWDNILLDRNFEQEDTYVSLDKMEPHWV